MRALTNNPFSQDSQMNLVSCSLQLEHFSDSYRPGDVIKGFAVFNVNGSSPILIKGELNESANHSK